MSKNIIKKIKATDNEYFKSVKFIDENTIASHSFNFKEKKQILRIESNTLYHEQILIQKYYKEQVFIVNDSFITVRDDNISFYDIMNKKSKSIEIKKPIEKFNNKDLTYYFHLTQVNKKSYVLSLGPGYSSAKYFISFEIKNKNSFFKTATYSKWLTKPIQPEYKKFSPLYYNTGLFEKRPKDWLGIKDIIASNGKLYFYTNGGKMTRTKSGRKFEISEIGIMDLDFNIIDVKIIKDGYGKFSTNGKYFIQQDYKEKRNLHIYDLSDFSSKTVRLTPTRNLGDVKKQSLFADLFNNKLLIYDHSNITISELK